MWLIVIHLALAAQFENFRDPPAPDHHDDRRPALRAPDTAPAE